MKTSLPTRRRRLLAAGLALGALRAAGVAATTAAGGTMQATSARESAPATRRRVVVVGGGFGGLAAARRLHELAPDVDVVLVDRNPEFRPLPGSNRWLAGLAAAPPPATRYDTVARALGYRFVHASVEAIDRERRLVATTAETLPYDWLVIAAGIRYDYAPWFGDDRRAADEARTRFPAGFVAGELDALRTRIDAFRGGDFLMVLPAGAHRCPPAPYERAMMIAARFKRHKLRARLVIVDPGPGMQAFNRVFAERYRDQIEHLTHAAVTSVDPFRKRVVTEFDELGFDDAIIMPPQQAAAPVWLAGLAARGVDSRGTGWGAVDPLRLHAVDDDRVFLAGDALGRVSPLFGLYPKSGHLAARTGRIVAREIAARAHGRPVPPLLPDSVCYVVTDVEPMERMRIDADYRLRGDGLITQAVRQTMEYQPGGEDEEWAQTLRAELLGR